MNRVDIDLGDHLSHLPSHFFCAGAPNKTKAGPD
jgi:hypothetical protein